MGDLEEYYFSNKNKNLNKWHHYFEIYEENFHTFRNKKILLFEIGVFRGGSLQMWKSYFGDKCLICGIDINPDTKIYQDNNIKIFIGDQTDEKFIESIVNKFGKPDIVIDDGGHTSNQQITSFNILFKYLNEGGLYLVEDTHTSYNKDFMDRKDNLTFTEYAKKITDNLNEWYIKKNYKEYKQIVESVDVGYLAKHLYRVSFYNSIISFFKKQSKIPRSELR